MGKLFVLIVMAACAGYWIMNHNVITSAASGGPKRIYERYDGNFLEQTSWADDADTMVTVVPNNTSLRPFQIDAYEATIVNAPTRRAWSVAGNTPTTRLPFSEAQEACRNAGKRLCTLAEWQTACRGGRTNPVRFTTPDTLLKWCDFARSKGYDKHDYPGRNNSHPNCRTSRLPLHHMVGNLSEFVTGPRGAITVVGLTYYDAKMQNKRAVMQRACERVVAAPGKYPANRHNEGLGFRCCK